MKVVVTGPRSFSDVNVLQRALEAFHQKHHIRTLIVGDRTGAELLAFNWAKNRRVAEIIVAPTPIQALTERPNHYWRNRDLLRRYEPDAVIVFAPFETDPMMTTAAEFGVRVWDAMKRQREAKYSSKG